MRHPSTPPTGPTHNPQVVFLSGSRGSGVEFIHSLLDSHPHVLSIPFPMMFHYFWRRFGSKMESDPDKLFDLICKETGIGAVLNNYHDPQNPYLGLDGRTIERLSIDKTLFRETFKKEIEGQIRARRTLFIAIYRAYAATIGQDWGQIRVVLENSHNTFYHNEILEDFPEARFISPLRDPHAVFASCRKGRFGDAYEGLSESSILAHLYQTFLNQEVYHKLLGDSRYLLIKNEEIHKNKEQAVRRIATWLGIDFNDMLMVSTFAGSPWEGNSAYREKIPSNLKETSPQKAERWKRELRSYEVILVECLFGDFIRSYGYAFQSQILMKPWPIRLLGYLSFFLPVKNQLKLRGVSFSLSRNRLLKYLEYVLFPLFRSLLFFFYRLARWSDLQKKDVQEIDPNYSFFPKIRSLLFST